MALYPLHHEFPFKDRVFQHRNSSRHTRGEILFDLNGSRKSFPSGRTFPCPALGVLMKAEVTSSSTSGLKHRKTALGRDSRKKTHIRSMPCCLSSRGKLCLVRASSETKTIKKRLQLLDSYFGKLQSGDEKPSVSRADELTAEEDLESLSVCLDKQQKEEGSVASKLRKADIKSNNNSSFQQLDDDDQGEATLNFYTV
ncbi:unnamed protein product [Eruca vesicaria subsp. sativa]|uniref:Uncharacterized protein n=1 Tax=Eruca vesicaria subsp. sativa TaxID=29727 RepID=A0ABC8JPC8_ERUVS|nr:unnamed protein product [Eruca vesicaria subsp. sativa]